MKKFRIPIACFSGLGLRDRPKQTKGKF